MSPEDAIVLGAITMVCTLIGMFIGHAIYLRYGDN